jgi:DNA-binding NarL/FixJ family response regulator
MTSGPPVLPLAAAGDPVRYVLIDDEPRYRQALAIPDGLDLALAGSYGTVEAFIAIQRQPCHVVVLDLCLNRQTGDHAVLQGVRAIRQLSDQLSHRVVVYTADERPEPVVRCVAAGAVGYVSKYDDSSSLARGIRGRQARQHRQRRAAPGATQACSELPRHPAVRHVGGDPHAARNRDERSADRQEATTSVRTIEDHKRKILEIFGTAMEARQQGLAGLSRDLGIRPGDLVNDRAGHRPARGLIARAMPWAKTRGNKH